MNFAHTNRPGASIATTPTEVTRMSQPFELLVLGFVVRRLHLPVTIAQHAPRHEQVDDDEDEARDPERDRDGVVDRAPIGRDRREVPRTQVVKQDRTNDQQHQCDCYNHSDGPG